MKKENNESKIEFFSELVDSYLTQSDWRVNENSNVNYSLSGLNNYISGEVVKNYWLRKIYPDYIGKAHASGDFHIHDLSGLCVYCCGHDLAQLLTEGFCGVPYKSESGPAKHFRTALLQIVNFLFTLQNEASGAQAFSNFDTYMAPFIREDNLSYKEVKQTLQEFVYNMNISTRQGGQCPFSNVTLDFQCPNHLKDEAVIIGGKRSETLTYGDFQEEMNVFNKAFLSVMTEGDSKGRVFPFPVITVNVDKDFDWDNPRYMPLWENTAKYGLTYFCNYINSDMKPEDSRSMCPLEGNTKIMVKTEKGFCPVKIKEMFRRQKRKNNKLYQVWTGKEWRDAIVNEQGQCDSLCIKLSNGESIIMGKNHLNYVPFINKTIPASELKEGMYLPFNKGCKNDSILGSFEYGVVVGAFAGDGSFNNDGLNYSLCGFPKGDETEGYIRNFFEKLGFLVTKKTKKSLRTIYVGENSRVLIERFVEGTALTKKFKSSIFRMSNDFLDGILYGLHLTDGDRRVNRMYTSSKDMVESVRQICAFRGIKCLSNYIDSRQGRLGENDNYRIDMPSRDNYGDYYKTDCNYFYYRIESITPCGKHQLYCLEVDSDDHLFMLANGLITHNCRLRLDLKEIKKRGGGLFGASAKTGSIGVVTINLPRLGHVAKDEADFFERLKNLINIASESLEIKRKVIEEFCDKDLYPYTKYYMRDVKQRFGSYFKNHFSTIGFVGLNECCLNLLGKDKGLVTEEGHSFGVKVLDFMNECILELQKKTGSMYNLEATPAEGTSYRLAKKDRELFGDDIIVANQAHAVEGAEPYYTNSCQLPVDSGLDVFSMLDNQDELQTKMSGGTVIHLFIGEKIKNPAVAKEFVRRILTNYKAPYISLTPTFSICQKHGYIAGEEQYCPVCGKETEVYSRIVGYLRSVKNWNLGKKEEFKDRKTLKINSYVLKK